ncbi:MAG: twitching motility protein PilT [Lachnospiraceae bacterium]|nr:twitching motility protein PilT [Lachnospiraceae bacterium]MDY5640598.1 twitching motility protein PilT [Lachnospiraceae bacterium]
MVQLIVGEKGKGKTKHLLDKVNSAVKTASGNIVYLDKNSKHMYELRNAIRLIATSEYPISNTDEFMGFICGIVSQDHDIEEMYLDSFRIVAFIDDDNKIKAVLDKLSKISDQFKVNFTISISVDESEVPAEYKSNIIVSL